jgi:hypothetical protein
VKARLVATGLVAVGGMPKELDDYTRSEIEKWGKIVKALDLHVD